MRATKLGQILRDADGVHLQFRRSFPDTPITEVWSACTDPDRLGRWFGRWTGIPAPAQCRS